MLWGGGATDNSPHFDISVSHGEEEVVHCIAQSRLSTSVFRLTTKRPLGLDVIFIKTAAAAVVATASTAIANTTIATTVIIILLNY